MKRVILSSALLVVLAALLAACGDNPAPTPTVVPTAAPTAGSASINPLEQPTVNSSGQPQHISVQHILIGFKDAIGFQGQAPEKAAGRTQEQAKALAYDIMNRARGGENYDTLVQQYTDDQAPGIYGMSNTGVQPAAGEYPREGMVAAFGNVGFTLQVGEIGMADYDPATSPYGYHIIKRVK